MPNNLLHPEIQEFRDASYSTVSVQQPHAEHKSKVSSFLFLFRFETSRYENNRINSVSGCSKLVTTNEVYLHARIGWRLVLVSLWNRRTDFNQSEAKSSQIEIKQVAVKK